jgi:signal transduction histidine kinase/CheY-like chemotaxis protein
MERIQANTYTTIWLCLAALIVSFMVCVLTARWITQPIVKLSHSAKALARGEWDQTVEVQRSGDLGELAASFNDMAQQLQTSFAELQSLNETLSQNERMLEDKVAERTHTLHQEIIERQRAEEAAKAASAAKSAFLANMSHELRTPLNAILGFSQLMRHTANLSPDRQEQLDIITRSGERLLTLLNNILEMSKIEAGKFIFQAQDFNLHHLLEELQQLFQPKAQSKGLQFTVVRSPDLPEFISTDASKLRQVLVNLLSNAVKFTQVGKVTLRASLGIASSPPRTNAPYSLSFAVEDTGPGIAPTELEQLFEPFMQTETGRESQEGTGLGLPISRKFVELMGGTLTVESHLGMGSCFQFTLRADRPTAAVAPKSTPDPSILCLADGQPPFRILIAEAKPNPRQMMLELLKPVGFEVREAENGQAAIALCQQWSPHLVWMDLRMPVLDGYAATRSIKASAPAPIIIALTEGVSEKERSAAIAAGCDDVLGKPFPTQIMFEKIAEYLGVRYLYQSQSNNPQKSPTLAMDISLTEMPTDWREQLHQAAICVNAKVLYQLIAQIPPTKAAIADALTDLVDNFRYEEIVKLSEH